MSHHLIHTTPQSPCCDREHSLATCRCISRWSCLLDYPVNDAVCPPAFHVPVSTKQSTSMMNSNILLYYPYVIPSKTCLNPQPSLLSCVSICTACCRSHVYLPTPWYGRHLVALNTSAFSSTKDLLSSRFCARVCFSFMCCLPLCRAINLPLPLTRKRLAAAWGQR